MKLTYFIAKVLAAASLFSGCQRTPSTASTTEAAPSTAMNFTATTKSSSTRVSQLEALAFICHEIAKLDPKARQPANLPLTEVTTPEIWNRLHIQIFTVGYNPGGDNIENEYEDQAFIIHDRQAVPLGISIGGFGVMSMCVADLADDGQPELVFSYSWGSGIHRSIIGMWNGGDSWIDATAVLRDLDLYVEKIDDQHVEVIFGTFSPQQLDPATGLQLSTKYPRGKFGILQLSATGTPTALQILLDPQLPADIRARIWYLPQPATSPSSPR